MPFCAEGTACDQSFCPLQVGVATDKAQYIHRLGRTARAGKSGKGMLLLGDFEERFLNSLSELPLTKAAAVPAAEFAEAQAQVQQGLAKVDDENKSQVSCSGLDSDVWPSCPNCPSQKPVLWPAAALAEAQVQVRQGLARVHEGDKF